MALGQISKTDMTTSIILDICVNIKNLRMTAWGGPTHLSFDGLQLARGTQKLKLKCLDIVDARSIKLGPLLANQPTLTSLRMPFECVDTFGHLLPTDLPQLRSVAGRTTLIGSLVPDRSIEEVDVWITDATHPVYAPGSNSQPFLEGCGEFFRQLRRSTKLVKRLVLRFAFIRGIFLREEPFDEADTVHKVIGVAVSNLKGLEDLEIRAKSIHMPLVRLSSTLSIQA